MVFLILAIFMSIFMYVVYLCILVSFQYLNSSLEANLTNYDADI